MRTIVVRGHQQEAAPDERLARLRNRKAAISNQIDERRAAARFEPVADEAVGEPRDYEEVISDASGGSAARLRLAPRPLPKLLARRPNKTHTPSGSWRRKNRPKNLSADLCRQPGSPLRSSSCD